MKIGELIRKKSTNLIGIVTRIPSIHEEGVPKAGCDTISWIEVLWQNQSTYGCWSSECIIL